MNKNESLVSKVNALRGKGMNLADACEKVGIKLATYGYYQKKKRNEGNAHVIFHENTKRPYKRREVFKNPTSENIVALIGSKDKIISAIKEMGVL